MNFEKIEAVLPFKLGELSKRILTSMFDGDEIDDGFIQEMQLIKEGHVEAKLEELNKSVFCSLAGGDIVIAPVEPDVKYVIRFEFADPAIVVVVDKELMLEYIRSTVVTLEDFWPAVGQVGVDYDPVDTAGYEKLPLATEEDLIKITFGE